MKRFRLLWAAAVTSGLGNGVRWVALPLLAAGISTDPRTVALVTVAEQTPWLLFGLVAGVVVDRYDRRRLLWWSNAVRGVVMAGFALAVALHAAGIAAAAAVGFAITCGDIVGGAASAALVPALVPPDRRPAANSRLQAGDLIADTLLGSPLGAVLFGLAAVLPFALDAGTFLAAAVLVAVLPGRYRPTGTTPATVRADLVEGVRFLWRNRLLRALCALLALANLVEAGMVAILVLYAGRVLGLGATGYGLLIAAFAVGGMAGAAVAPRLAAAVGNRTALLGAIACCSASGLLIALTGRAVVAGTAMAIYGAASTLWTLLVVSLRQALVPDRLMGRVTSGFRLSAMGATPLGALGGGFLAHAAGLRAPFLAGTVAIALALVVAAWRLPGAAFPSTADPVPAISGQ